MGCGSHSNLGHRSRGQLQDRLIGYLCGRRYTVPLPFIQVALSPRSKLNVGTAQPSPDPNSRVSVPDVASAPSAAEKRAASMAALRRSSAGSRRDIKAEQPALSILTTPYLCTLCFGNAIGPVRRPNEGKQETSPWIPAEGEGSKQANVAAMSARAPVELKPKLLQARALASSSAWRHQGPSCGCSEGLPGL